MALTVKDLLKQKGAAKSQQPKLPAVKQAQAAPLPEMELVLMPLDALKPWEDNPRINDEAAIKLAGEIKRIGFRVPIVVTRDGIVRAGHTRLKAAQLAGLERIPAVIQDFENEEEAQSFSIADNRLAEEAKWDPVKLESIMERWQAKHGSISAVTRLTGFTQTEIDGFRGINRNEGGTRNKLFEKFVVPPFTVLDARQGYWKKRKEAWLSLGIKSELGRNIELNTTVCATEWMKRGVDLGGSVFDPVLCELVYKWFCPKNGVVLDQFAGGSVRGVIAACLGLRYFGVDLSEAQVKENKKQALEIRARYEAVKSHE